jgi:hypothetical protein
MRTSTAFGHAALFVSLISAAACGGGGATGGPQVPTATPSGAPSGSPSGGPAGVSTGGAASGTAAVAPPAAAGAMKPVIASAFAADLKAMGFDTANLPPLKKMPPDKLRLVMKTFSKSLGTQCTACHDGNDFRAPTKNKKIAGEMWDKYVRGLALDDGSALYCDSCHQGKLEFLDRHDKKALGAWMDANFVAKLKRTDKKDHGCETCHGEDMDMRFLAKWTK